MQTNAQHFLKWSSKREDSTFFRRLIAIRVSSWNVQGLLSISCLYDYFHPKPPKIIWAPTVWSACITPKHFFVLWLCAKAKLLTKDRIQFLNINRRCCFVMRWRSLSPTCSSNVRLVMWFGLILEAGWAFQDACPRSLVLPNGLRRLGALLGVAKLRGLP